MSKYKTKTCWNYRIGTQLIHNERVFSVFEIYYSDRKGKKPDGYVERTLSEHVSIKDIKWTLKKIKKALKQPIIDLDNFPNEWIE